MRLGTRDQAIPQAIRPSEGLAALWPQVPVMKDAPEGAE
jgi:hypothetical protein